MNTVRLSVLLLVVAMAGCTTTIVTPGADDLPRSEVARLTADSRVGTNNFAQYTVFAIVLDGVPYGLNEKPVVFLLAPGRHTVRFGCDPWVVGACGPGAGYYFDAKPGATYVLTSLVIGSAGMSHRIATAAGDNVLKVERSGLFEAPPASRSPAPPEPQPELDLAPPEAPLPPEMAPPRKPDSV